MGIATNGAVCQDCSEKKCKKCSNNWDEGGAFCLVIEWLSKENALKRIKETKCLCCGSDNWSFTDDMGQ